MRNRKVIAGLFAIYATGACNSRQPVTPLSGEWAVQVSGRQSTAVQVGAIVFDARIPCYCDDVSQPPDGAIQGRAFVDWQSARGKPAPNRGAFATGPDSDMSESVAGLVHRDGTVIIEGYGAGAARLTGRLDGDSIRGSWVYMSHSDTVARGTFRMSRVARSEYSDSAHARARRGVRKWRRDTLPVPTATLRSRKP